MTLLNGSTGTPCVDNIYKERNRLKNEQHEIQKSIKKTIHNTEDQIHKLKNKIKVLEEKRKTLIIEFNKECDKDDRIRGTTPPQIKRVSSPIPSSPKSHIFNKRNTNVDDIKKQLESDRFVKMVETVISQKINKLNNKIDLQEKERQLENEKREKRENESSICSVM